MKKFIKLGNGEEEYIININSISYLQKDKKQECRLWLTGGIRLDITEETYENIKETLR